MELLNEIQQELDVPKNRRNDFGGYDYRSAEDILEAVKPLLGEATLTLTDKMELVGDRYYVKATATLKKGDEEESCDGYAREIENKKKSDPAQITGAASSYARKYALNGLFAIAESNDPDTTNTKEVSHAKDKKNDGFAYHKDQIDSSSSMNELRSNWNNVPKRHKSKLENLKDMKKKELTKRSDGGNKNPMTDKQWEFLKNLVSSDKIDNDAIKEDKDVNTLEELDKNQASDVIEEITENDGYREDMSDDIEM